MKNKKGPKPLVQPKLSWKEQISLLSPAEEEAFWLECVKEYGAITVNRRYCPIMKQNKVLQRMVKKGILIQRRVFNTTQHN